jgi:CheY-like chemotaxis protein
MDTAVKKAFHPLDLATRNRAPVRRRTRRGAQMPQPRLLLIDDEPALAEFLANAARETGFEPVITSEDSDFRDRFREQRPDMVALDLGMPGMDGVELLRFLAEEDYRAPVLIVSGFDRRVLESAFRLGEALGLTMAGPVEKPVRLEVIESLLNELKASLVPDAQG